MLLHWLHAYGRFDVASPSGSFAIGTMKLSDSEKRFPHPSHEFAIVDVTTLDTLSPL